MELINLLFFIALVLVIYYIVGSNKKKKNSYRHYPRPVPTTRERSVANPDDQLHFVSNSSFHKNKIMNKSEFGLFCKLENLINSEHCAYRVFPQVSMGEIIGSDDKTAYRCINSKRVDFVIVNAWGEACVIVEYQGSGHYQGDAAKRDAVKREVCKKVDILFFEVQAQYNANHIQLIGNHLSFLTLKNNATQRRSYS